MWILSKLWTHGGIKAELRCCCLFLCTLHWGPMDRHHGAGNEGWGLRITEAAAVFVAMIIIPESRLELWWVTWFWRLDSTGCYEVGQEGGVTNMNATNKEAMLVGRKIINSGRYFRYKCLTCIWVLPPDRKHNALINNKKQGGTNQQKTLWPAPPSHLCYLLRLLSRLDEVIYPVQCPTNCNNAYFH